MGLRDCRGHPRPRAFSIGIHDSVAHGPGGRARFPGVGIQSAPSAGQVLHRGWYPLRPRLRQAQLCLPIRSTWTWQEREGAGIMDHACRSAVIVVGNVAHDHAAIRSNPEPASRAQLCGEPPCEPMSTSLTLHVLLRAVALSSESVSRGPE